MWKRFRLMHGAKPVAAALIIGAGAVALATQVGATELAVGAMAAYVTYRMVRYGLDLKDALVETVDIERGIEPTV